MHDEGRPPGLAAPPRGIPLAFRLAELLPFRWRYLWTLLILAIGPVALWLQQPVAFAAVAVLTLVGIYAVQLHGARVRLGLLKWGRVAHVVATEKHSRAQHFNVHLPIAHGWTVTRERWSGPNTETKVTYTLDGQRGELVLRGREYVDGVILADARNPARARCVTAFAYDLDRDQAGDWVGALRPTLRLGMACWSAIAIGWLVTAALAATGTHTTLSGESPAAPVPQAGTLQLSGTRTTKTVACNGGYLSVSGVDDTITVTGHCTSVTVSGNGNRVTVDNTDAVSTSGRDNVVTYHWGSPKIADAGTSNSVRQG